MTPTPVVIAGLTLDGLASAIQNLAGDYRGQIPPTLSIVNTSDGYRLVVVDA